MKKITEVVWALAEPQRHRPPLRADLRGGGAGRPGDFAQFMGSPVLVKTYQPKDGRKEFAGTLAGYEDGAVLLDMGGETVRFEKNETALVRLRVEF